MRLMKDSRRLPSPNAGMAGFTLLEILIAVVILSIGLLGLAGMQIRGSEGTNTAYFRSQATMIANDMAERLHVNRPAVDNNAYADVDSDGICADGAPAPDPYCSSDEGTLAAICTPDEMATYDIYTVSCDVGKRLPTGRLTVVCDDAPCNLGSPHTITVSWQEANQALDEEGNGATAGVIVRVLP